MHFSQQKRADKNIPRKTFGASIFVYFLLLQHTKHAEGQVDSQGNQYLVYKRRNEILLNISNFCILNNSSLIIRSIMIYKSRYVAY